MSEDGVSYAGAEPDETFAVSLPAEIAETVRELAAVHVAGDACAMVRRIVIRALDPVTASRMEAAT